MVLASIAGLTLPWNFLQGMIFWDATFAPVYVIIAFWAFSRMANPSAESGKATKAKRIVALLLLPLALIASAYTYRPISFLAVGCYVIFYGYLIYHKLITKREILFALLLSGVAAMPLAIVYLTYPMMTDRARELGLSALPATERLPRFWDNWRKLLSLDFLFRRGDPNRRHSIGSGGMVGVGAIIPILSLIYFKVKKMLTNRECFLIIISVIGIGLSMLGSALTFEAMPHSLRANGAQIFFVILIAIGLIKLYQNRKLLIFKLVLTLSLMVILVSIVHYIYVFEIRYLPVAKTYVQDAWRA